MWRTVLTSVWWLLRRPQLILYGWMAMWGGLLYASATQLGVMNAVQFSMTSLFNLGSVLGLPIPMAALALMFLNRIIPMIQKFLVRSALGLWKAVQAQAMKVTKVLKRAKLGVYQASDRLRQQGAYIGSSPADDPLAELDRALDDLGAALAMIGM
jgi:hypothetical protein